MTPTLLPEGDEWPVPELLARERLEGARSEEPFRDLAVGLATEFGALTSLLARVRPERATGRDDAVLRGLAVRIVKLTQRLIAETFEGRGEMQALLDRLLFESVVDLAYLLRGGRERTEAFVRDSLHADRVLWDHLARNAELRGGDALPMEARTRERLEASFALAGVAPEDVPAPGEAGWPPLDERLRAIGEPDAFAMHQLGAGRVHGAWNELVTHHLAYGDDFEARLEWSRPLVQPLFALAIQGARVMAAYARHLGPEVGAAFRDRYLDLARRASDADALHEEYMARADLAPPPP